MHNSRGPSCRALVFLALAVVALGMGGCRDTATLGLKVVAGGDMTSLVVTNRASTKLTYSEELLASPVLKRRDGDFYLVVEDSGRPLQFCGMVDTPIPEQREIKPGAQASFKVFDLADKYCLKNGKSYTLSVKYKKTDSALAEGVTILSSSDVSFVARNLLTSDTPVSYAH